MKHIIIISLLFGVFVSCNKFLDTAPLDKLNTRLVFSDKDLAENVVRGAYSHLRWEYSTTANTAYNWDAYASVMDPMEYIIGSMPFLTGNVLSTNGVFLTFWKVYYEGINRANDVINNIHLVPNMSEELKARRIAECKFLRAWYYYCLNCRWRGVPVYLENLAPEEYTKPRLTENQVWEQIIDDCSDCIECESLPEKYSSTDADYGRITKGAAYTLRGKVYMWQKEWKKAESDFRAVGDMGYNLYQGSYSDLFTETNERCDEMIFSVQLIDEKSYGNALSYYYGTSCSVGKGNDNFVLNTDFVDSYELASGKPFNWDDFIPGYSGMTPQQRSIYFCRNNMTEIEKETMSFYGADMTKYDAEGNEDRIRKVYAGRDPRLAATAILPYSTYDGGATGSSVTYTMRFPYRRSLSPDFDLQTRYETNMFYIIRKFVIKGTEYVSAEHTGIDMPIFRYADVLLCLAESLNEQGETDQARVFVDRVRSRAGVAPLEGNEFIDSSTKELMRERIIKEKKWELACETSSIYTDELRWGTWHRDRFLGGKEGVKSEAGRKQVWGENLRHYTYAGDFSYYWAIPQSEIERNRNLTQNEGWY